MHFSLLFKNPSLSPASLIFRQQLTRTMSSHALLNKPAPRGLKLQNQDGKEVTLVDDFAGKSAVIYFYPKDETSGCTAQACAFRDNYEVFQQHGAEVVGISSDSVDSHKAFASNRRLPFTLLADPKGEARKAFQVPNTLGLLPGRATYIIGPDGTVKGYFNSMTDIQGHIKASLELIQKLKE
ncbi:uncharacterized protein VTP21DRAFT_5013 [Calcarisporiella thermophila]|uniref:uncharacterized protein n=1 Tax=Calcarisporiella thermophila TaxID=911321 RepID=UPI003743DCBD